MFRRERIIYHFRAFVVTLREKNAKKIKMCDYFACPQPLAAAVVNIYRHRHRQPSYRIGKIQNNK